MKKITRAADLVNINQEERTAEFVISSEAVDRHGTVFKMDGWDIETYKRNPIVCYNHAAHGTDPDTIIGTSDVYAEGGKLIGRVTFEQEGDNELADKVWRKLNKGILKMASVGALAHEYRWGVPTDGEDKDTLYFTRQELLEWSIVSVGSNPEAFKRSAEAIEELKQSLPKEEQREQPLDFSAYHKQMRLDRLRAKLNTKK